MSWEFDELLNKARCAEEVGNLWVAHRTLRRALELDQTDFSAWALYGDICNQLEQFSEAIIAFEHAIVLKPTFAGAYSGLALALVETGRLDDAARALSESLRLRATSSRWVLLADVQRQLGDDGKAEASLREALRLQPNDEEALFNLAVLVRDRDPEEAIALLSRALDADPQYAAAYRELAGTLLGKRALGEAERALNEALRLNQEDARAHLYRGQLLVELARPKDALAEFDHARFLSPFWPLPLLFKARLFEQAGNMSEAEAAYRLAIETSPDDADSLAELGRHLLNQNEFAEAEKLLSKALRLEPNHSVARDAIERLRLRFQQ